MTKKRARKYIGFSRRDRVSEAVLRCVSQTVTGALTDPRLDFVNFTMVEMSPDNRVAKVYYNLLDPNADRDAVRRGLEAATGRLRRAVAEEVRLQFTPELRFVYDTASDHAAKIDALFREISVNEPPSDEDEGEADESGDDDDE